MIAQRERRLRVENHVIAEAIELFTTPVPTTDGRPPTSVLQDIELWRDETRGQGGRPLDPNSIRYTFLGIVVAFFVLIRTNREISESSAWTVLIHEFTDEQREKVGMTGDLSATRYREIACGTERGATAAEKQAATRATQQEYARLSKAFSEVVRLFDPSPFPKSGRLTAELRKHIRNNPEHEQRRITADEEAKYFDRLHTVVNKIVAVSVRGADLSDWHGDLATDETIVISHKDRPGVGTRDGRRHSADADAKYWPGKSDDDPEKGFGYGITYAIAMNRPYDKNIPTVALGMHIGEPTGGRVDAFATALDFAERNGLTKNNRDRFAIADMGYTRFDDWFTLLMDRGYKANCEYPEHWREEIVLPDIDADGDPVAGPAVGHGCITCPGCFVRDLRLPKTSEEEVRNVQTGEMELIPARWRTSSGPLPSSRRCGCLSAKVLAEGSHRRREDPRSRSRYKTCSRSRSNARPLRDWSTVKTRRMPTDIASPMYPMCHIRRAPTTPQSVRAPVGKRSPRTPSTHRY